MTKHTFPQFAKIYNIPYSTVYLRVKQGVVDSEGHFILMTDKTNGFLESIKDKSLAPCDECQYARVCAEKLFACELFHNYVERGVFVGECQPNKQWYNCVFRGDVARVEAIKDGIVHFRGKVSQCAEWLRDNTETKASLESLKANINKTRRKPSNVLFGYSIRTVDSRE